MKKEINIRVINSAAVSAGALWFPLSETGGLISDKQYTEDLPLRNYAVENSSDNETDVILNPAPVTSGKRWTVPAGKTRESDPVENLKFYNIAIVNNGANEIAIGELEAHVRNY